MAESSMRKNVITGAIWKFMERIIAQGVSLIVSILLARMLEPSDYGVVGFVMIFFAFANVIISGGLNTALIQKKDAEKEDYCAVFTISFIVAIVIYLILFITAPFLARVFRNNSLVGVIRVLGISLPIFALKSVVSAYISSKLQFKKFFFATLFGTIISAFVGIVMAKNGGGAWALVAQQLTNAVIDTLILVCVTGLRLKFMIDFVRIKGLMRYGTKILMSSLLGVTISQITPLFIGLKYSSADLSFYTKGKNLPETMSTSMTYTLSSVLFPALSKYQNDKNRLLRYTRMYMQLSSFIVFPVMLGFAVTAKGFVSVFLTERWLPIVYYIQISCLALMFDVIAAGNCETIKAMGRSDIYLKIEIIKKTGYFGVISFFLAFTDSPDELAISLLVCTVIQICVNSVPNRKLIGYKGVYQIMDIVPNLFSAVAMSVVVIMVGQLKMNVAIVYFLQVLSGIVIYFLIALITNNPALEYLIDVFRKKNKQ